MLVDGSIHPASENFAGSRLGQAENGARALEEAGYDGGYVLDGTVDPFLALGAAARGTQRLDLLAGVAIAFSRSPMTTALQAWNLQDLSRGRLVLGLGSQVRPHIERRFSMPWGAPAARMREYVLALRAIWDAWSGRRALDFEGEFYTHTLMTPNFDPGPLSAPDPLVLLGALGPRMSQAAGEVADGLYGHPFVTADFVREVQLPAVAAGRDRRAGDLPDAFVLTAMPMIITGRTPEERALAETAVRKLAAFYASTPSYFSVLEHHGYDQLGPQLNALSRRGEWTAMADLIDDDLLALLAIKGTPLELPKLIADRCGYADRVTLYGPYASDAGMWSGIARELRRLAVPA